MLVAQLTDLHLDGTPTTRDRLQRVVGDISAMTTPIDLVMVTGDIVERSAFANVDPDVLLAEYRLVHELLAPLAPVAWCPGNSDDAMFDRFMGEIDPRSDAGNQRLDRNGLILLMLDTRVPGEMRGHLDGQTLGWLERQLAGSAGPVILVMHHPPIDYGHPVIDTVKLDNPGALETILHRFPQVIGILCGHTHTTIAGRFADRPVFVAPAVHSAGRMPWAADDSGPVIDPTAPPAWAMHRIDANGIASLPVVLREGTS